MGGPLSCVALLASAGGLSVGGKVPKGPGPLPLEVPLPVGLKVVKNGVGAVCWRAVGRSGAGRGVIVPIRVLRAVRVLVSVVGRRAGVVRVLLAGPRVGVEGGTSVSVVVGSVIGVGRLVAGRVEIVGFTRTGFKIVDVGRAVGDVRTAGPGRVRVRGPWPEERGEDTQDIVEAPNDELSAAFLSNILAYLSCHFLCLKVGLTRPGMISCVLVVRFIFQFR